MKQSELKKEPETYQINAKICRLVEKFPCMYDRSHPQYLKKDVVDKAWIQISKEMDDSIPSCKERWRNIRTSFARSINVNKSPASANRTKPYYLHEELKFLARHITPGVPIPRRSNAYSSAGEEIEVSVGEDTFASFALAHTTTTTNNDDTADDNDDNYEEDGMTDGDGNESQQSQNNCRVAEFTAEAVKIEQQERTVEAIATISYPPKKRRRSVMEQQERPVSEMEQKYSEQLSQDDSEFDSIFLQGLLPEMKAMDFRQKILFKRRIYEVISEIFENAPSSSTSSQAITTTTTAAASSSTNLNQSGGHAAAAKVTTAAASQSNYSAAAAIAPTMTVVNAADLAMIRRLNSLLQKPQNLGAANTLLSTMVSSPKNGVASISSTVRSPATPATATVAVNRGSLTRSTSNLMRVTMVNPPAAAAAPTTPAPAATNGNIVTPMPQVIKQEPEVLDD